MSANKRKIKNLYRHLKGDLKMLKPLADHIVVELTVKEEKTSSGIYLPDNVWLQTTDPGASTSSVLTWRQRELLTLLAKGNSNKQMAALLTLTEGTVKRHLHNIFRILDANNRVEAVNIARERNLLLNLGA